MNNEFSWERYMAGYNVTTRDGREVLYIEKCLDNHCECEMPILYLIRMKNGCVFSQSTMINGRIYKNINDDDLIMAPGTMDLYFAMEKNLTISNERSCYIATDIFESKKELYNHLKWANSNIDKYKIMKITVDKNTFEQVK